MGFPITFKRLMLVLKVACGNNLREWQHTLTVNAFFHTALAKLRLDLVQKAILSKKFRIKFLDGALPQIRL